MTPQSLQSVSAATPQGVGNYYLPYNQFDSMSSPISRRTTVTSQAPALPKKEPLSTVKSPIFAPQFSHILPNSHILELARINYAIKMFGFMCAFSAFFVFLGLNRIDKLKSEMPSMANRTLFGLDSDMIIWETSISISIVTVLSSVCVFFVSGSQLFFLLKVLKTDPKALNHLHLLCDLNSRQSLPVR
uniref:Transmembrane protein 242 n=1 Tax=Steinernema glaseri TaxID=37863 RepID=A0A1I7ZAA0_9BILA